MKKAKWLLGSILCVFLLFPTLSRAIAVADSTGSNTNPPPPLFDLSWDYVGYLLPRTNVTGAGSAVYLGNSWFITAFHAKIFNNPGTVRLNETSYLIDSNSWVCITGSSGTNTDLVLFKSKTTPGYPPPGGPLFEIRNSPMPLGADVSMIGCGGRSLAPHFWTSDWIATNAVSGVYSGYLTTVVGPQCWGINTVISTNSFNNSFGTQEGFQVTFDANGESNECQAISGDAGGGVFYDDDGVLQLAGVMLATAGYPGQPSSTAVFGNQTYIADLSYYRDQIIDTITESANSGNLNVTVQTLSGSNQPNALVKLYNNDWTPVANRTTDADGVARFSMLGAGIYIAEAYLYNSTHDTNEFWGGKTDINVLSSFTTGVTIQRHMPYASDFQVYSGDVNVTGGSVSTGTPLTAKVWIHNPGTAGLNVKSLVWLDRTNTPGTDYSQTSSPIFVADGSTVTQTFSYTANSAGDYSRTLQVQTDINDYQTTDAWSWNPVLVVSAPVTLSTGLIAYYPFNGNANDESGNGHDGTITGATLTADRFGNASSALLFNGTRDKVSVPSSSSLMVSNWTVSAWTKRRGDGANGHPNPFLVLVRKGTSSHFNISVRKSEWGVFAEARTESAWFMSGESTTLLDTDEWHFVTGTYSVTNGGTLSIYVDGCLESSSNHVGTSLSWDTEPISIGGGSFAGVSSYYGGVIDDVRIYNRALSQSEIMQLYTANGTAHNYWTIMVYMMGDSDDLRSKVDVDLNSMEDAVLNGATVVVMADSGGVAGVRRGRIVHDENIGQVTSPLTDLPGTNIGLASTLSEYVLWAESAYPADHYALIMWDHGAGLEGVGSGDKKLYPRDIRIALQNADFHLDLISFDACLMGMVEVAYELRNVADYMTGSEELSHKYTFYGLYNNYAFPYPAILSAINNTPNINTHELARTIVSKYSDSVITSIQGMTQSAIDLAKLQEVGSALNDLAAVSVRTLTSNQWAIVRNEVTSVHPYDSLFGAPSQQPWNDYRDLGTFLDHLAHTNLSSLVTSAALQAYEAVTNAVAAEWHGNNAIGQGLSAYLPDYLTVPDPIYRCSSLEMLKNTEWALFVEGLSGDFIPYIQNVNFVQPMVDADGDGHLSESTLELEVAANAPGTTYVRVYAGSIHIGDAIIPINGNSSTVHIPIDIATNFAHGSYDVSLRLITSEDMREIQVVSKSDFAGLAGCKFESSLEDALQPRVTMPVITPDGGTFSGSMVVTAQCFTVGSTIRYTTDGSEPSSNSTQYSSPFTLTSSSVVKAKAFLAGCRDSLTSSAVLTLDSGTRVIGVSGDLDFGNVSLGSAESRTMTISNNGNSKLTVTSISCPTGFSCDWSAGYILPGTSRNVTVYFSPTSISSYGGVLTINSNATGGQNTISVSGTGTTVPSADEDADGIPDSWEQQYFGSTNANPNAFCSNGINTIRGAYIAGLDPKDPNSSFRALVSPGRTLWWNAVSGRVYDVYWTTNLLNGFQCLESNVPWTRNGFTNLSAVPCGYYRINVHLEE